MADDLHQEILAANIAVHKFEARQYELLHPEVFGRDEQKRIDSTLKTADRLITRNQLKALDFGAGTGNLTGKLLSKGYTVTSVDISAEMCAVMAKKYQLHVKAGRLSIISSPIENANFAEGAFDLITCYSVLHHLPDYESVVRRLSRFLKNGGVMYIDHEASPFYWSREPSSLASLIKSLYFHSNPILNALYFSIARVQVPNVDYVLSDYWHKKEHPFDHHRIQHVFQEENFEFYKRTDYHSKGSWIPNPILYSYRYFCRPEMSYWIAKK